MAAGEQAIRKKKDKGRSDNLSLGILAANRENEREGDAAQGKSPMLIGAGSFPKGGLHSLLALLLLCLITSTSGGGTHAHSRPQCNIRMRAPVHRRCPFLRCFSSPSASLFPLPSPLCDLLVRTCRLEVRAQLAPRREAWLQCPAICRSVAAGAAAAGNGVRVLRPSGRHSIRGCNPRVPHVGTGCRLVTARRRHRRPRRFPGRRIPRSSLELPPGRPKREARRAQELSNTRCRSRVPRIKGRRGTARRTRNWMSNGLVRQRGGGSCG